MHTNFINTIKQATKGKQIFEKEIIQNLWSGYGQIVRYTIVDGIYNTVIVKHIRLPKQKKHPRGWNTDLSHNRKVKSYEVEIEWYKTYSKQSNEHCRLPKFLAFDSLGDEILIVLEDLDDSGFPKRKSSVKWNEIEACIQWLAHFHATYLHTNPVGLWETGTYWHLETRPEELKVLNDIPLKKAAQSIDEILSNTPYKTIVHGDAKLANFCFSADGNKVAAVDFQYVGGGCGMKDLAYFIGSCLYEEDCEQYESKILNIYFTALKQALSGKDVDFEKLESNWRTLYPYAWTDFHRFLKGWSPGHWKINSYSEKLSKKVIAEIEKVDAS